MATYTFKIDDSAYVNTLVTCLGQLGIVGLTPTIEGLSLKGRTIDELPKLIEKIKEKRGDNLELTLMTGYRALDTLHRVLPEFELQDCPEDPQLKPTISRLNRYISCITNQVQEIYWMPPVLPPLTKQQAWAVLNSVYKKTSFFSAMDLPSQNSILILTQCGAVLLELHYGPEETKINDHVNIYFDIDKGFVRQNVPVPVELTQAFDTWVKNNREGFIFAPPRKKFETFLNEITQHAPLLKLNKTSNLAKIVADYAYIPAQPKFISPFSENPISPAEPSAIQNQAQSSTAKQKHKFKYNLIWAGAITAAIVLGGIFALSGFAPIICVWAAVIGFGVVALSEILLQSKGYKKTKHYVETEENKLTLPRSEQIAFKAGVKAGKSYGGFFRSWAVPASYTNYSSYFAGKQLAEAHTPVSDATIAKIKRNPAGTYSL